MTEYHVLRGMYDRVMQRIFAISANHQMTIPKKGMEAKFREEKEMARILAAIIGQYDAEKR